MDLSNVLSYTLTGAIILICVLTDILYYKVFNKIVYPGIFLGLLVSIIFQGWRGMRFSMVGILLTMLLLFFFYALRFIGAGDVKLFGVIGGFLGFRETFWIVLYSFLTAGVIGVIFLILRKNGTERFKKLWWYIKGSFYFGKLTKYEEAQGDKKGVFRFTYGILAGFGIYLLKIYLG
jgi:prepilin peptidase CpaA